MHSDSLLALSPLDGRYAEKVKPLRPLLSEFGLIKYRVLVEVEWLKALANNKAIQELPPLDSEQLHFLQQIIDNFESKDAQRIKEIEKTTNHDVKAVEYYLKEKLGTSNSWDKYIEFIHFACTSEDINNLSYALMLKDSLNQIILPEMQQLTHRLTQFAHEHAKVSMLSRTHGQTASPTTLGKEMANFASRLKNQMEKIKEVKIAGKMNGAVGNFNAHYITYPDVDWVNVTQNFIERLGLKYNLFTTQIEPHDFIAELCNALALFNTIVIDFNRDIWSYISIGYFLQQPQKNEIGSSTMPHKINPIDFENAEGNLGIANALLNHFSAKLPISRWQRDLTDSTVLRNLGMGLGYSLIAYSSTLKGLQKLQVNYDRIASDLNNSWEVLAEALQTVMRRYAIPQPYEKLKSLTRGKQIDQNTLRQFIESLHLPEEVKKELLLLTPDTYLGIAEELARKV